MKLFNSFVVLILFFYAPSVLPTSVNGRFTVLDMNSSKISVLLQINTDTGTDDLGGATIVFGFDTTGICFTSNPVSNVDYIFHNFSEGNYSSATVTKPMKDKIWVNIDLPFNNNNNGTVVVASPEWTDIVTIYFDVVDPNGIANLFWFSTSSFWGIYDADNATLWEVGEFEDLVTPLLVELSSFTAVFSEGTVQLKWVTETEVNNYGFDVERKVEMQEWNQIGFLAGYGNSNSPKTYSFADNNLIGGNKFQYRLKQIDTDGQYEYSKMVEVEIIPGNFELHQNYPNPFNPSTKIKYTIPSVETRHASSLQMVTLKVFDILGNEVATLVNEEQAPGAYEVEFSTSSGIRNLVSGIYFYQLKTGSFIETKKMILLK